MKKKKDPNLIKNEEKVNNNEEKNKNNKSNHKIEIKDKDEKRDKKNKEKIKQFDTDIEDEESNKDVEEDKSLFIKNLMDDLSSNRFILLIITYIFILFSNYSITLIYLPFSIIFNYKMYLNSSIHLTIYMFVYCISSIFFGIFFDLKNARFLVVRLILLSSFTVILFFATKYFPYILDLLSILNAICLSGTKTIIYPMIFREFINNDSKYYLISIFLFAEIIVYSLTPIFTKYFAIDLKGFIVIFFNCLRMLFGGYIIMTKKLFPIIPYTNESYDINTKKGKGLKQLSLQDELPPLSKE